MTPENLAVMTDHRCPFSAGELPRPERAVWQTSATSMPGYTLHREPTTGATSERRPPSRLRAHCDGRHDDRRRVAQC